MMSRQLTIRNLQVYGLSKLMNIMWAKALNEKLKGTGVEAFSAHPGRYITCYRPNPESNVFETCNYRCNDQDDVNAK